MFFTTAHPAAARRATYSPSLRSLDRFLEQARTTPAVTGSVSRATLNETDTAWTLSLDMPGVTKEQLLIGIEGQSVRVETLPDAPRQYQCACELPQDIDAATSIAKLEHGVLTLTLTKQQPASKVTQITIN
jgi:HSP20 family molecular chaperone IbpA